MTAKERAIALLDRRDYSRRELIRKLMEKGEDPTEAEEAVDHLVEIGFVNDSRYSKLLVRHYAAKGYGEGRVKQELSRRGIDKELWDEALTEMPEQDDAIDRFIARRLRGGEPDRKELKKVTDALLRRGFTYEEVRSAMLRYNSSIGEYD